MKRELSVEDLFAPLNRLDVRHPSSAEELVDNSRVAGVLPSLSSEEVAPKSGASLGNLQEPASNHHDVLSSSARRESAFILEMAPIPEEAGLPGSTQKSRTLSTIDLNPEDCTPAGLGIVLNNSKGCASKDSCVTSKSNAGVSDSMGLQIQGNSTSDEDQQLVDNRKQRRMLSNRESARRSRLRKQQHLDELRGQIAQLQAQNSQMVTSFNLASQQFAQITEENQKLRAEAMNLSHQLQRLHHVVTSQRASNGLPHSTDTRHVIQAPRY